VPEAKRDNLERYEMFYEEIGSFQLFDNNLDYSEPQTDEDNYDRSYLSSDAVAQLSQDAHGQDLSEHIQGETEDESH
jgi:hypothetical protein